MFTGTPPLAGVASAQGVFGIFPKMTTLTALDTAAACLSARSNPSPTGYTDISLQPLAISAGSINLSDFPKLSAQSVTSEGSI